MNRSLKFCFKKNRQIKAGCMGKKYESSPDLSSTKNFDTSIVVRFKICGKKGHIQKLAINKKFNLHENNQFKR